MNSCELDNCQLALLNCSQEVALLPLRRLDVGHKDDFHKSAQLLNDRSETPDRFNASRRQIPLMVRLNLWIHSPVNVQHLVIIQSNDWALTKMKQVTNNLSKITSSTVRGRTRSRATTHDRGV